MEKILSSPTAPTVQFWQPEIKAALFEISSYLTEPVCQCRQKYYEFCAVKEMHPNDNKCARFAKKFFLVLGILGYAALALIATIPGIILRSLAVAFEKEPFIFINGPVNPKSIENDQFSLLAWNICGVVAGYSITDGGVTPIEYRQKKIADAILVQDSDVVCLYEVFDILTANYLIDRLKETYPYFIYNIGARGIGPSSALFIASKLPIDDLEFTPFPKETLVGRTKGSEKGVLGLTLSNCVRLYTTHLQHSEIPAEPLDEEKAGRRAQMELILQKANEKAIPILITGDLNMDDDELTSLAIKDFSLGTRKHAHSWRGDAWCAKLMGKTGSSSRNLDYTMGKSVKALTTKIAFTTFFNPDDLQPVALSDHSPLLSTITLQTE